MIRILLLSLCLSFSDNGLIDELEADVGDWQNTTINGTLQSRTHGDAHELIAVGANSLALDAKGNTTTDDQSRTFVWDFDNRLRSSNASGAGGSATLSFTYDALGRRVSKTASSSGGGGGTTTTVYVCSGQQVLSEYLAGQPASNPIQSYVYGSYVDEPLLKIASGVKHYYHTNRQFCVTALTDSSGAVVERYAYTSYGSTLILDPPATTTRATSTLNNSYMYTGRRLDKEFASTSATSLYYYRARYHSPTLGRFINRDPIHYSGGINLYAYTVNQPTGFTDWSGNARLVPAICSVIDRYRSRRSGLMVCDYDCACPPGATVPWGFTGRYHERSCDSPPSPNCVELTFGDAVFLVCVGIFAMADSPAPGPADAASAGMVVWRFGRAGRVLLGLAR